ncbi:hypothetical protein WICMUC_002467 [Wickerhamomyces mucosus]|uniref:tRNA wybutosine-synthesizing protein 4 n=1 Tax=Wickerhamomyces mucosus TaxID=1378264 RepID=A0A9P8PQQ5_9ASCO|nr:hypothetical protein WICMUC_002467 [Wickerhamomyces mucosus]
MSISKVLTPEQTEKQKKKIEKDRRRRQFHDISVQGTNDYSIVSKRSVEKLYSGPLSEDPTRVIPHYFQHFVKKAARRSPAINRGYWTRMESIKNSSYKIIQDSVSKGKKVVVINLGAGYDPLAFQYLDPLNPENSNLKDFVQFVDVDYPDLNKIKIDLINQSQELKTIIGEPKESNFTGVDLKTPNYTVLSCDLKNINLFLKQLEYLELNDENITKIYIAEVSIAYMLPKYADPVIKATSQFPNSHFLLLEQLLPSGLDHGFARTMMFHFSKLNSPLNSVETYPTIEKQIQRFTNLGYNGTVEAQDLFSFWKSLPREIKEKVNKVEHFDEWEEFIVFGQHYLILHASNCEYKLFQDEEQFQFEDPIQGLKFSIGETSEERKFLASGVIGDQIISNGGSSISRLNSSISNKEIKIIEHDLPARVSHTLSTIDTTKLLLAGGRAAPNKPLLDCWILEKQDNGAWKWEETASLPASRFRHAAFTHNSKVYIYGGSFNESPFVEFDRTWKNTTHEGPLKGKQSAALAYNGKIGVVIGGMNEAEEIESSLYTFEILEDGSIKTEFLIEHALLNRYGAQAIFVSSDEIVLLGGVSQLFLHNQTTTIVKINLSKKTVTPVELPNDVWKQSPLLVGFQFVKYKDSFITLNGGAVCYSFGSIWNNHLILNDLEDDLELHLETTII